MENTLRIPWRWQGESPFGPLHPGLGPGPSSLFQSTQHEIRPLASSSVVPVGDRLSADPEWTDL